MQTIYQPGLASENCYVVPAGAITFAVVLGLVIMALLVRYGPRNAQQFRTLALALMAMPALIVGVVGYSVVAGAESIVRVATDGSHLEYRYCSRLALRLERHPLTSLTASHYRREIERRRNNVTYVHHKLDLQFWGRAKPITLTLDASPSDIDLDLAERIAPEAVATFRAAAGR